MAFPREGRLSHLARGGPPTHAQGEQEPKGGCRPEDQCPPPSAPPPPPIPHLCQCPPRQWQRTRPPWSCPHSPPDRRRPPPHPPPPPPNPLRSSPPVDPSPTAPHPHTTHTHAHTHTHTPHTQNGEQTAPRERLSQRALPGGNECPNGSHSLPCH